MAGLFYIRGQVMIGKPEELIAYAAGFGVVIGADEAPILLNKATFYLNTLEWAGSLPPGADDSWPRTGLVYDGSVFYDTNGDVITAVTDSEGEEVAIEPGDVVTEPATPKAIVTAAYQLAMQVANGVDLLPTTSGAQVVQESVSGAVSVTYAEGTIGTPLDLPWLSSLIGRWSGASATNGINFSVMRG